MLSSLVTPPAALPLSLAEAKLHLRLDTNEEDTLVSGIISAATGIAEEYLRRRLISQVWEYRLDEFPSGGFEIPYSPLVSVGSLKYIDADGVLQTFSSSDYTYEASSGPNPPRARVRLAYGKAWPSARSEENAVRIAYTCGWADAASVPDAIKAAIRLIVGSLFANREDVVTGTIATQMPKGSESLLRLYRLFQFV